ncbi:MAG: imidazole glycerol phosphate synthase subunit HisF [Desulfovibrionaceae bacterium]
MLKIRVVPALLLKEGRMVKTRQFADPRDTGDPMTCVRVYDAQGADELLILDISASVEGRAQWLDIIGRCAGECFIPLSVGGGIRTVEDARRALAAGADRVSVSTAAVERPEFVGELATVFGRANIVVCMDVKLDPAGRPRISSHGGRRLRDIDPLDWAREMERRGAGEILVHSVDRDGMMQGYDLDLLGRIAPALSVPVMALGGVGTLQDLADGVRIGQASAVAAASIFHFTDQSPIKAHSYLHDKGVPVCLA